MIFQHIPYGDKETESDIETETLWDDSWHEVYGKEYNSKKVHKIELTPEQNGYACPSPSENFLKVPITNYAVNVERKNNFNGKDQ